MGQTEAGEGGGILYEIRSPRAQAPSWLFATIHSEDPRVLDTPRPVRDALESSDAFALEVVPDSQAILKSMVAMTYTDGRTLREVLPEGLYLEAAEALGALGMPSAAFRDFKPWAVVTLLSIPPADNGEFLDLRLYRAALAGGKRVQGLESMEEQLQVFDGLAESDQIALLRETLASRDRLPVLFETLIQRYLERDLDGLTRESERLLQAGDPRLAALFREQVVDARNLRMVERMAPLLDEGGWFVAVGALHLPAETGILGLLARRGYSVKSVY
jgi:uncharacterized protein YbaP (TraB family)